MQMAVNISADGFSLGRRLRCDGKPANVSAFLPFSPPIRLRAESIISLQTQRESFYSHLKYCTFWKNKSYFVLIEAST